MKAKFKEIKEFKEFKEYDLLTSRRMRRKVFCTSL